MDPANTLGVGRSCYTLARKLERPYITTYLSWKNWPMKYPMPHRAHRLRELTISG